jgi:peptide chain release factor subunit 1
MLLSHDKFGFIIVDGNGALFGLLQGNQKTVLEKFTVDLPRKHGRGGQSKNRFERIRTEKRHQYMVDVAEAITDHFISDNMCNVKGFIIAGSADIKYDILKSDLFDPRLKPHVIKCIDIAYGGEAGFSEAIHLAAETLQSVKYVQEKKVLSRFYEEIARDSGKYVFGVRDTIRLLLDGLISTLIVFEDFDYSRVAYENGEVDFVALKDLQGIDGSNVKEKTLFNEWLLNQLKFKDFVENLEFVSNCSSEGAQFFKSFSGIGGILKYKISEDLLFSQQAENEPDFSDDFI